jgi:phage RecT family recombinase
MSDPKVDKKNVMELLNATPVTQIPVIAEIAQRFKETYALIHNVPDKKVSAFYETEKFHFMKIISENKNLQDCTKKSLYGCWMDVAVNGLSFDPSYKHVYLVPFKINVGTKQAPKWEKRAQLMIGGPGELLQRKNQGQIKYADNPKLVYEGDDFLYGSKSNIGFVNHTVKLPRKKDAAIIAAYILITRADGTTDSKVVTQEDMDRYRKFSKDPDSVAWTKGIGGMWEAKAIKHAFRSYPKVRLLGSFSVRESDIVDKNPEALGGGGGKEIVIDYGDLEDNNELPPPNTEEDTTSPKNELDGAGRENDDFAEDDDFDKKPDQKKSSSTKVEDEDDDF